MLIEKGGLLGSCDRYEEYQIDRTIINVMIDPAKNREELILLADKILSKIWSSSSRAIDEAIMLLSNEVPDIWVPINYQLDKMLIIYSISITPEKNIAGYHVGLDPVLQEDRHPKIINSSNIKYVDDITIYVTRDGENKFTSELIELNASIARDGSEK